MRSPSEDPDVDGVPEVAYAPDVVLPAALNANEEMSEADQVRPHAAIEQSITEIEAGQTVSLGEALASLRRKRHANASR